MNKSSLLRSDCPVCTSRRLGYAFSHSGYRIARCTDCNVMFTNPQPSDTQLAAIYDADYFLGAGSEDDRARTREMKRTTAREFLAEIKRYCGPAQGRLLEVGCGEGDFLVEAEAAGFAVTGIECAASAAEQAQTRVQHGEVLQNLLEETDLPDEHFDLCVLSDVLDHVRDPQAFLEKIHRLLKPNAAIFIASPSLTSWSAKLLRQNWMEFKPEHLTYFDPRTIQTLLLRTGFCEVIVRPEWKTLTLDYIAEHFERFHVPYITPLVRLVHRFVPAEARKKYRRVVASGLMAFARKTTVPEKRTLSVVLPAFNEAATFEALMEAVLRKQVPGLDIEIVLVESNSTDGTRDLALKYRDHPRVRLVLEDRPQGKGHAVRTGLAHARGDFILIQDADLEYDLEDYDALLEPLISSREAFTLGARHGGGTWKMRQFNDQPLLSTILNMAHWGFTALINVCFLQRLKDPFTMYKVFRRDCLYGLRFECNRFDFDWELLIKLVRKGYRPFEMPVNYRSRSFKEGKKVSLFRDPISWLQICFKLRFEKMDPLAEVERCRVSAEEQKSVSAPAITAAGKAICI